MTDEIWRQVAADARYEVSNLGRVRRASSARIRVPSNGGDGYQVIVVSTPTGHVAHYVHRLVAAAFIGDCPEGMEVSHINGDRRDNRAENLVYETHRENLARRIEHGTDNCGDRNGRSKLSPDAVREIRSRSNTLLRELAEEHGVSISQISRIRLGQNWGQYD